MEELFKLKKAVLPAAINDHNVKYVFSDKYSHHKAKETLLGPGTWCSSNTVAPVCLQDTESTCRQIRNSLFLSNAFLI